MADPSDRYIEVSPDQASAVRARIEERMREVADLTPSKIKARGKVSQPTVTDLLGGTAKRYWRSSLRKASHGVGWTPTSIETILEGGEPTVAENDEDIEARLTRIEDDLLRQRDQLLRQAETLARLEDLFRQLQPDA